MSEQIDSKQDKLNITIVTSYYPPDFTSLSNYYKDIAEDLAEYGANVTLVCGIPTRLVDEDITKQYAQNPVEIINKNLRIIRTGPKKPEGKSLLSRAFYHTYRCLCIYKQAKKIDTDIYYICSAPTFLGFFGTFLSKKAKTIYDLEDIFPDTLIVSDKVSEKNILMKLLRKYEQYIYKNNNHIKTISQDMLKTLTSRGVPKSKISVVYNWIDEEALTYIDKKDNILFDIFNLSRESFYVGYAGNMGLLHDLSTLVNAAQMIEECRLQIKFLIIGDGARKNETADLINQKGLKNIHMFPMQEEKYIPYNYNLPDIGFVTVRSRALECLMPSKTWNTLSASRPVICEADKDSELYRIITDKECGICVTPGDAQGLVNAILKLYNDNELSERMGKNGREYIEKNLKRKESTNKLYDCIMRVYNEG